MMIEKILRKRLIPDEVISLKGDIIVHQDEEVLITKWNSLNPRPDFSHGVSCCFLKEGIKISKHYRSDGSLLRWYCDIMEYSFDETTNTLLCTDLLADVILYPDGHAKVVDLDELADALEKNLITKEQMLSCLRSLNYLLSLINSNKFDTLQSCLDSHSL